MGLQLSDKWTSDAFRAKAGRLSQTLKHHVKGRNADDLVLLETVCEESTLCDGFVYNAIESHLLRELNGTYDAGWDEGGRGRHILIPENFGLHR